MIFVGMLGGALTPIIDLGLQGTVFEEGAFVYVAYGAVLGGLGGHASTGRRSGPGGWCPEKPALGLALLGVLATILASLPYYVAGFVDQPAASAMFDYDGPSELWNVAVTIGHALMALVVAGLRRSRPARRPRRRAGRRRPVGRPDARVADDVTGSRRQLRRDADGHVRPSRSSTCGPQPLGRSTADAARPARPPPAPPPRRQVFVGTALAGVAMLMLTGGMLGVWILMRERSIDADGHVGPRRT